MEETVIGIDPMLDEGSHKNLTDMRVTPLPDIPLPPSGRRANCRAIKANICSENFMAAYDGKFGGHLQASTFAEQAEVVRNQCMAE